ncbi:AMP-binding protein [Rhodococcus sp. NM-2]|uniref:AMP-binding protein n=1 Tax=Rhodococcus sp. NM-2 TaxID=3401174 RepID=UPI003AAA8630
MFYPLNVWDYLHRAESAYPDRIAVVDEPDAPMTSMGSLTYRELARAARAHAARLDSLGIAPGARIAFIAQNSARLLSAFFGVSGHGRVLVPINFRLSLPEIQFIIKHSGAEVVYCDPEQKAIYDALDVSHKFLLGDDDALYRYDTAPRWWSNPDEGATATINYTSGTTALPKGVQLTHRNNWLNAAVFGLHTQISDRDIYLHTLPMFHANGWGMPFAITGVGGKHIIVRKIDGAEILRRIDEHGVTMMCAAPAVIAAVLDAAAAWEGPIPGRDRVRIVVAGAPPPTRVIERVLDELGWEFIQLYGLTETSPLITINRHRAEWDDLPVNDRARNLGRAGIPALGVRIDIDADGEVLAASNHNLEGYWNQPEATADAQRGGWFHSGDGGHIDSDGYLVISDRKKDVIISGGENVSSIEVEDTLMAHPAVREAAVIGIPDEKWGELVTALVVVQDGRITPDELVRHCRSSLAGYKCPKRVEFIDELPRTTTGKIQKFKLREQFWIGRDRGVN